MRKKFYFKSQKRNDFFALFIFVISFEFVILSCAEDGAVKSRNQRKVIEQSSAVTTSSGNEPTSTDTNTADTLPTIIPENEDPTLAEQIARLGFDPSWPFGAVEGQYASLAWRSDLYEMSQKYKEIDLRKWSPPVRDQGSAGTCGVFSIGSLFDIRAKIDKDMSLDTSETHIAESYSASDLVDFLQSNYIVRESDWPYDPANFDYNGYTNMRVPEVLKAKGVVKAGKYKIVNQWEDLFKALQAGYPVNLMVYDAQPLFDADDTGYITESPNSKKQHYVSVVGMKFSNKASGGGWLIIRNSWGEDWGDHGYGYLPFAFCQQINSCDADTFEVLFK